MTVRVVVSDRIRMPRGTIPIADLKDRYIVELFDESRCAPCSNKPDRGPDNEMCQECPAFEGVHRFFNSKELKDGTISLPQADAFGIRNYLRHSDVDFKWIDKRVVHPRKSKFKFIGQLYKAGDTDDEGHPRADQQGTVAKWLKKKTGKIVAKPRAGKTMMATYLYTKLRVRTVIIANQRTLLNQFYETACGVPAPRYLRGKIVPSTEPAGRKAATDIPARQERTGKQIIFMPETFAQLEKFLQTEIPDVLLITYQSFMNDMSRVANIINKYYSFAIIDEEHGTGADAYLRFVASLDMKYRLGLTATPDRKDGRSKLSKLVVGPTVAKTNTVTLMPTIEFYPVRAAPKKPHKSWLGAARWAKTSQERNVEIVQAAFADLRKAYDVIIIPVDHKDHMEHLVKVINRQAKNNFNKRGENWPDELARPFWRGVNQLETLNWVDSRDKPKEKVHPRLPTRSPRILVAIRSMIRQGVDMKRPSMLYSVMPMSAKYIVGAPMFQQLSFRVCTPSKKLSPVVKVFVDNVGMFAACASSLLYQEILPKSTLKVRKDPDYIIANYDQASKMIANRSTDKKKEFKKWW